MANDGDVIRVPETSRMDDQIELQRLRQENERLRIRDEEWAESHAQAVTRYAQARALLERMTKEKYAGFWTAEVDDYGLAAMRLCVYCSADDEGGHASDCPIVQARAFLAEHPKE